MAKAKWNLDLPHSSLDFSVRHMMVSRVKGTFNDFEASIVADPNDLTTAEIELSVDLLSIDTRNKDRDKHLRTAEFFDIENHPKMTFTSTDIVKKAEGEYDVTGELTIRGTTRPVTLAVETGGQVTVGENDIAGFSGETKINRTDFGLTWNPTLETGGVVVSDEVKISFELEVTKEA
jgi:polyisoprenoid-binding protein YceI